MSRKNFGLVSVIWGVFEAVMRLVFVYGCVGCGRGERYICDGCWEKVGWVDLICPQCGKNAIGGGVHEGCRTRWGLDGVVVVARYEGVLRKVIYRIKYRGEYALVDELVKRVETRRQRYMGMGEFEKYMEQKPVVSFVPSFGKRENRRGFNQAKLVACCWARERGFELKGLLLKIKDSEQIGKGKEEREKNVEGLFEKYGSLMPEEVIMVDDVWTTGATMRECCRALKKGGVKKVWGLAMGR